MDDLEKVETIRTKCNVSYTDAKAALDAADGNVLDAIIWLESQGKTQTTSAHAATESEPVDEPSAEMVAAQAAYEKSSEWLMLIGLFFGMRYRIDSNGDVPGSINNLMDHAADAADDIKQNLNDDK